MSPSNQQPKPCYFLAPSRTCPPEGYIRLGSIIASPSLVDDPINSKPPAVPDAASVTTHSERDWSRSVTTANNSGRFGIWASFLQMILGVGGDVGVSWANEASQTYTAKVMRWNEFRPSLAYMKAAVADKEVDEFLRGNKLREKIFMVTGVMVASGAAGVIKQMRDRGLYAHVGVDATILSGGMAPVAGGPDVALNWRHEDETSFKDADDFVFAFRLRQIKVKKTGEISHKPKVDGALFGVEDEEKALKRRIENRERFSVLVEGLSDEDATASEFRSDSLNVRGAVDEDGGDCLCVEVEE
jgi:hypothetical protein